MMYYTMLPDPATISALNMTDDQKRTLQEQQAMLQRQFLVISLGLQYHPSGRGDPAAGRSQPLPWTHMPLASALMHG